MKITYTHLTLVCAMLTGWTPVQGQFVIEGSTFTNYGAMGNYQPYTEVSAIAGSMYEAAFGARFNHYESDPLSLRVYNNYNANGPEGGSTDYFNGPLGEPGVQGVSGIVAPNFWNLVLQNGSSSAFNITNSAGANIFFRLDFLNGITTTVRSNKGAGALHFQRRATYTGGLTDAQHVNGYVSKVGSESFTFPVGNASSARPLSITAPAAVSARITTAYEATNVESAGSLNGSVKAVFEQGSWDWIVGSPTDDDNLTVTVSLPNVSAFAPAQDLRLVGWNGSAWIDLSSGPTANGNLAGSTLSGVIPPGVSVSQIGVGSVAGALPVTLMSFRVREEGGICSLEWLTTDETDSDYFEVQRSADARTWRIIGKVEAQNESGLTQLYKFADTKPVNGFNYYRLRMVDNNGSYSYSDMRSAQFDFYADIILAPNPAIDKVYFKSSHVNTLARVQLIDMTGKTLSDQKKEGDTSLPDMLDLRNLSSGVYLIRLSDESGVVKTHKIIKE